jgi:hypothetical protein
LSKPAPLTEKQFTALLAKRKVQCDFQKNEQGNLLNIRFVDHFSKTTLTCQEINLSLSTIKAKLRYSSLKEETAPTDSKKLAHQPQPNVQIDMPQLTLKLLKGLLENEDQDLNNLPEYLKKKRKKRRPKF